LRRLIKLEDEIEVVEETTEEAEDFCSTASAGTSLMSLRSVDEDSDELDEFLELPGTSCRGFGLSDAIFEVEDRFEDCELCVEDEIETELLSKDELDEEDEEDEIAVEDLTWYCPFPNSNTEGLYSSGAIICVAETPIVQRTKITSPELKTKFVVKSLLRAIQFC
jgi:hypothetical protein